MRAFTAIQFAEEVKDSLMKTIGLLKERSGGNFTRRENLHLTLEFLGEIASPAGAIRAMEKVEAAPFALTIERLGSFSREGGSIVWAGIREAPELMRLQSNLRENLAAEGFKTESRAYRPHLTLVRESDISQPELAALSRSFPALESPVTSISLMKSERIKGRLVYTEIYRKDF